jgi:P-type conjugative transfer protein TrbL
MNDLSVIDHFLDVFSHYIDSGFGLLHGEVAFLTATLVVIDMTLAGLFWAMGGEDVIGRLIKKTLYVGAFAFIIGNFNYLAGILFNSFAGLGLVASGSTLTQAQFLQPGHLAKVGVDAAQPIMAQISDLTGFPEVFANLDVISVLFLAWLVVIVSFFVLAVQLFVTLIEFKLTTLAGFVLVPFALWNKTAFLAERVLGNVVSSGIKVLVLAVIVGIGTGLFAQFQTPPNTEPSIDLALTIMLASLAMLGLGIFGPGLPPGWCPAHRSSVQVRRPARRWARLVWWSLAARLSPRAVQQWRRVRAWCPVPHAQPSAERRRPGVRAALWQAARKPPTRLAPPHRVAAVFVLLAQALPMWPKAVPIRSASASQPERKRSRIASRISSRTPLRLRPRPVTPNQPMQPKPSPLRQNPPGPNKCAANSR